MPRGIFRLAVLAALAFSLFACNAEPPLRVAPHVDLSRFAGKWYEIARLPRLTQTDCHGTTAFYTQNSDGSLTFVNQCNVGAQAGPVKTVSMSASVPDTTVPAKLTLDIAGVAGDYWILEVDSNYQYAVVGHPSRLYFWILSRAPTLDTTTVQGIVSRAQSDHFDMSQLEYTPQPPPDDRTTSGTPVGSVPPPLTTGCSLAAGAPGGGGPSNAWLGGLAVAALAAARARRRDA
jgi:apolipoprotein D and lipocalin family protein